MVFIVIFHQYQADTKSIFLIKSVFCFLKKKKKKNLLHQVLKLHCFEMQKRFDTGVNLYSTHFTNRGFPA